MTETCRAHETVVTVTLHKLLAPFRLQGTESLAIYAKDVARPVLFVEASDPSGTEINEFHSKSEIGCVPNDMGIALVKGLGGNLDTLLIVLAKGTVKSHEAH